MKQKNLLVRKLSSHVYVHTSFLTTQDFGKVPYNGMLVLNNHEAIKLDTPVDNQSAEELIKYATHHLNCKISAVIPTHFHDDCVGGLEKFNEYNIPSYASKRTIQLLRNKGTRFSRPIKGFDSLLTLNVGDQKAYAVFLEKGIPGTMSLDIFRRQCCFGGCLIKEIGASKGNL